MSNPSYCESQRDVASKYTAIGNVRTPGLNAQGGCWLPAGGISGQYSSFDPLRPCESCNVAKIGRASCRERVEVSAGAGDLKKKRSLGLVLSTRREQGHPSGTS